MPCRAFRVAILFNNVKFENHDETSPSLGTSGQHCFSQLNSAIINWVNEKGYQQVDDSFPTGGRLAFRW